jgi:hypothetical protein
LDRLSVEDEWLQDPHDRALSIDGGPMWFIVFAFRMWQNMRPDGATRGKWRIPDGKVGEWSILVFGASKVVAPACVN